jgi:hypothetical protein
MAGEGMETDRGASIMTAAPTAHIEYAKPSTPQPQQVGLTGGISRGDIAALAVRILGIYLIVSAFPELAFIVSTAFHPRDMGGVLAFYLAYDAVFIGVGTFMVIKAVAIGGWLLPKATSNPDVPPSSGAPQELQAVALSVVGIILAASAFPALAATLSRYADPARDLIAGIIKPGVEFAVGLFLFFASKRIAGYWQRLPARRPRTDDDSGPL